jgi:Ca2+-binding RTX toxin-like protein
MKLAHLGIVLALCAGASEAMAATTYTVDGVVIREGTSGNDSIVGGNGPAPEEIWGCAGNDALRGGRAETLFVPGQGNDRIRPGPGRSGYQFRNDGRNGDDVVIGYRKGQAIYFTGSTVKQDTPQGIVVRILHNGLPGGSVTFSNYHGPLLFKSPASIPHFVGGVCN